ncbi:MAG: hypothetical protein GOU98_02255 [Candidatus Altiarchaeota archaeon]|nr:hypothetical protein [Candidatus Altiarchaeota archaeon]
MSFKIKDFKSTNLVNEKIRSKILENYGGEFEIGSTYLLSWGINYFEDFNTEDQFPPADKVHLLTPAKMSGRQNAALNEIIRTIRPETVYWQKEDPCYIQLTLKPGVCPKGYIMNAKSGKNQKTNLTHAARMAANELKRQFKSPLSFYLDADDRVYQFKETFDESTLTPRQNYIAVINV